MKTAAAFLLAVATICVLPIVSAHAQYASSDPLPGSRLIAVPASVQLELTETVDPAGSGLRVFDAQGNRVDDGQVAYAGATMTVRLRDGLPENAYRVDWRALSAVDHHDTDGTFGFAVGNFTAQGASQSSPDAADPWAVFARALFFAGFSLALASFLFERYVARDGYPVPLRRAALLGWSVLLVGAGAMLLDTARDAGIGPQAWAASEVLRNLGGRVILAAMGIAVAASPSPRRSAGNVFLAASLMVVAVLSATSGHASETGAVAILIDAIHFSAVSAWVGGLALFAYALVRGPADGFGAAAIAAIGTRFSRLALLCVVVLAATGVILGILILGWPDAASPFGWFEGTYGRALLGKILLAATMVGLASVNRLRFLARWQRDPSGPTVESSRRRFGNFVAGEATVGAVVLVLAAVLTSAAPVYSVPSQVLEQEAEGEELRALLRIEAPPHAGAFSDLRFRMWTRENNESVVNDTCGRESGCILLEVVPPGANHTEEESPTDGDVHKGGEHRILEPLGDGWWIVRDVLFVEPGHYELMLEIQTEYVFLDVISFHVEVEGGHEGH